MAVPWNGQLHLPRILQNYKVKPCHFPCSWGFQESIWGLYNFLTLILEPFFLFPQTCPVILYYFCSLLILSMPYLTSLNTVNLGISGSAFDNYSESLQAKLGCVQCLLVAPGFRRIWWCVDCEPGFTGTLTVGSLWSLWGRCVSRGHLHPSLPGQAALSIQDPFTSNSSLGFWFVFPYTSGVVPRSACFWLQILKRDFTPHSARVKKVKFPC